MKDVGELIEQYRELGPAMTEKEKAAFEHQLWNARPEKESRKREAYLHDVTGGSTREFILRGQLHNAGVVADPLWERAEKDYTLVTCVDLLRTARRTSTSSTQEALRTALAAAMNEYDSRPHLRHLVGGKIARTRSPTRLPTTPDVPALPAASEATRQDTRKSSEGIDTARVFWDELRRHVIGYITPKLVGAPELIREKLYGELETDLKVLLDGFQQKLQRAVKYGNGTVEIYRKQVLEACRALTLEPPKLGQPVDLKEARRKQRRLAALYHPDTHKGDDSMRALYVGVMQAFDVLEQYNENLEARNASK